jgi:hypothetical protein
MNVMRLIFVLRYDFYEKAVTFKPYQVDMLDPVTANFLGDNLRCWMQIQVRRPREDGGAQLVITAHVSLGVDVR